MATKDDLKSEILKMITERGGGVTFVEMMSIDGFSGDFQMRASSTYENIYLWTDVSEEAAEALVELRWDGVIRMRPINSAIYAMSGMSMKAPVVKALRSYKKPRWLPVVWDLGNQWEEDAA